MACNCSGTPVVGSGFNGQFTAYPPQTLQAVNPLTTSFSTSYQPQTPTLGASADFCTAQALGLQAVSPLSAAEQSYTYNPQLTGSIPGTTNVNLTTAPYVNSSTYAPSISTAVRSPTESGLFVSYFVRPTSPYVNTCPPASGQ